MRIDLNADLGEGFGPWTMGDDLAMLSLVSTANIACGFHAGDPETMRQTIATAKTRGVAVGAHPGYDDLLGFGRRPVAGITAGEIENLIAYQTGAFQAMATLAGHPGTHVKTHGALGNACADEDDLADAVARGIRAADPGLAFMVMPGTATARAAERYNLRPIREIYADRSYADNFNLTPRRMPGAMIEDPDHALLRVLDMIRENRITSESGRQLDTGIDSVCIHGDSPAAVAMATRLKQGLEEAGYTIAPAASAD
ncbi:LamB/YcsF family protein [Rhodophyticola sp. CCM32]|uniref:LamB/YcsF family protein n=1 Tax=Rhodophyticola sp. CCM32 TaxID=2916397 RepID=UPI00107FD1A6|nr:5-oxoprolinase subunit PxpA [Rhodophyticola sp. CCM32]QBY01359.1 LamB/YcsF family protein [Rhodophyticola sp. CCM32]